jgi:hypothetical protein
MVTRSLLPSHPHSSTKLETVGDALMGNNESEPQMDFTNPYFFLCTQCQPDPLGPKVWNGDRVIRSIVTPTNSR